MSLDKGYSCPQWTSKEDILNAAKNAEEQTRQEFMNFLKERFPDVDEFFMIETIDELAKRISDLQIPKGD